MTNCVDINLHVNPLREDIDVNSYGTDRHTNIPLSDINIDFLAIIKSLNLKLAMAELFYTNPNSITGIHIDIQGGDYTKINYIYGGKDSVMCWYTKKEGITRSAMKTPINTYSIRFMPHEVNLIDIQKINFPSIIQAGIPHNVINLKEPRYCLSIVLIKQDNTRLTMEESINIFNQYIVTGATGGI